MERMGRRESEVGGRKSEVGNRRSENGGRKMAIRSIKKEIGNLVADS